MSPQNQSSPRRSEARISSRDRRRSRDPGVGHAITHSKMIVIDPFSDDCKVVTGSHNFSASASEQNDDNFVVVHGNRSLAEAYSVACLATYEHYSWRALLPDGRSKPVPSEFTVVFGIMRDRYKKSGTVSIPFFSKVSLRAVASRIELMGFPVEVHLVERI
ncbi:TIGR04141 family sporadically distributed protein [Bradyrhizobium sp. SSUT112]|nr:DUF6119 family protein [Bradyrhizobium sp. SSUT112]MDH2351188.1 TIGR04141 family sporadically distributed protein [Bradyrhizobium sp. SSUT112]